MGREQFGGTWKLVSFESGLPDGSVRHPFGQAPVGLAVFSADGHVAAQLMRSDRPRFASDAPPTGTLEEVGQAFVGYVAYFGRFNIDEGTRTLVTHVEGSLIPNWIGGDQVRTYEFHDGRIAVIAPPDTVVGQTVTSTLTWERV